MTAKPADLYTADFFSKRRSWPANSASVVVPIIQRLTGCLSVVDVGCGTGTWLAGFARAGITDLLGIDGDYVDLSQLEIDRSHFNCRDLSTPFKIDRTFDLAVCLEVAEHLPESSAAGFVDSLCALSRIVMFSAAVPHQGGTGHINTQWQSYWAVLFKQRNYQAFDCIRPAVWGDNRVASWYAQNTLVYVDSNWLTSHEHLRELASMPAMVLDVIHPEQYESVLSEAKGRPASSRTEVGAKVAVQQAIVAIGKALRRRLP